MDIRVYDCREQMADQIAEVIWGVGGGSDEREMRINFSSFLISECPLSYTERRRSFHILWHLY